MKVAILPEAIYRFNTIPATFFTELEKTETSSRNIKIFWKAKEILSKKNNAEGITTTDSKFYRFTVTKIAKYCQKTDMKINGIEHS